MVTVIPPENKSVLFEDEMSHGRNHGYGNYGSDDHYRPAERVKDSQGFALAQVLAQIAGVNQAVEKTGAAASLAVEKTAAAVALAVEKTAAAGILASERVSAAAAAATAINFSNTQNLLVSGFKDGRYDAATLTASILQGQVIGFKDGRYDAAVNAAALQKQISDCCCELKEAIGAEGDETRALINMVDARRADRELVDSKGEITLLKLQLAAQSGNGNGK